MNFGWPREGGCIVTRVACPCIVRNIEACPCIVDIYSIYLQPNTTCTTIEAKYKEKTHNLSRHN